MVHGIWKKELPRTSRAIAKVTNILKVRATLSTRSRVNHEFENPGVEYLLLMASRDAFENGGQNYHSGNTKHG